MVGRINSYLPFYLARRNKMVFSTQSIIKAKEINLFSNNYEIDLEDKSFFFEALNLLLNENNESLMSKFLNSDTVKDMSRKNQFIEIIVKVIELFMNQLDKLWNFFESALLNFLGKNEVIAMFKKKLLNNELDIKFGEKLCIYTNLDASVTYTSFKNELNAELSSFVQELESFNKFTTSSEIQYALENIKNEMKDSDDYLNSVRDKVTGSYRTSVSKEEYADALYRYFRNQTVTNEGDDLVTAEEIRKLAEEYFNRRKHIKIVKSEKANLNSDSKRIIKDIEKLKLSDYSKLELNSQIKSDFNSIVKTKVSRVKELCNIFLLFYSAKLDAVKDYYCQSSKILFKASKEITKAGK